MKTGLRWAISLEETLTSSNFDNFFRQAILCVSEEDVVQQRKFRFKEDALACLIGRVLPRKAAILSTGRSWGSLEFGRTETGKPFLQKNGDEKFEYNVSHHGDLVVFASGTSRIGVDVMRVKARKGTAEEQMDSLSRHFSPEEVRSVKEKTTEMERWHAFYRLWCLKESILKATGVGLPDGLRNHTFSMSARSGALNSDDAVTTSSRYFHRNSEQSKWRFEESLIGNNHCVAVALETSSESTSDEISFKFEMMTLAQLLENSEFVNVCGEPDEELDVFMEKPNKHF